MALSTISKIIKTKYLSLILELILFFSLIVFYSFHSLLISEPLKFYSTSIPHRLQTNALLQGKLSLSPQPFGIPVDFIWAGQHGMHQNWGLGVPLLRLPFEWGARLCSLGLFPDRLIIIFYLVLMLLAINISLKLVFTSVGIPPHSVVGVLIRFYLIAWILFSPPMSSLIQSGLDVYKETILYGCIYSYILLSLLLIYLRRPSDKIFVLLCLASGFAWLIRATLIVYGLVTFIFTVLHAYQTNEGYVYLLLVSFVSVWGYLLNYG